MERLEFQFDGRGAAPKVPAVLTGVVASGNLEVLMEPAELAGRCEVIVNTASHGFGDIWRAVLSDFFDRHPMQNVRISINDVGATPAVVSLRLDQAVEETE